MHPCIRCRGRADIVIQMPIVGFGLWKVDNATCADTVYNAIKTGYRLFDGACDYGNEKEAGEGFARAIKEGLVKREELFIVSKLWNSFVSLITPVLRAAAIDNVGSMTTTRSSQSARSNSRTTASTTSIST